MTRQLPGYAGLIACACAAWQPSVARAAEEDVQFWLIASGQTDLGEATTLTLDGSLRFRETARGGEQQTVRLTIDHDLADGVALGGGAGVFEAGGDTEARLHQQLTISGNGFSARTRIEERFFDGADRVELRLRQRLRYTQGFGGGWAASVDGEYLTLLQTRNRGGSAGRDQWRARAELRHRFENGLTIGAAYMAILSPRKGQTDRLNHIPQAVISARF